MFQIANELQKSISVFTNYSDNAYKIIHLQSYIKCFWCRGLSRLILFGGVFIFFR